MTEIPVWGLQTYQKLCASCRNKIVLFKILKRSIILQELHLYHVFLCAQLQYSVCAELVTSHKYYSKSYRWEHVRVKLVLEITCFLSLSFELLMAVRANRCASSVTFSKANQWPCSLAEHHVKSATCMAHSCKSCCGGALFYIFYGIQGDFRVVCA